MEANAQDFLKICQQFQLGSLDTESPNPQTINLSQLAQHDLVSGIETLKAVDLKALDIFFQLFDQLEPLHHAINQTLKNGNRIFMSGCGATGRLSLSIETFWKQTHLLNQEMASQVIGFMAGGDVALISSIERFEDRPEYGHRQLIELGFTEGDLLIGITEGGETPFVIGTVEKALELSQQDAFFLFCNPRQQLKNIERSSQMFAHHRVKDLSFPLGPMGLTGSTRMQASTILMLAAGLCLFYHDQDFYKAKLVLESFISTYKKISLQPLEELIKQEAGIYQAKGRVLYESNADIAITILTDTTERSPTFGLHPFDHDSSSQINSWCHMYLPSEVDSLKAWTQLLSRPPRALQWEETKERTSLETLKGFNLGSSCFTHRKDHHLFKVIASLDHLTFDFNNISIKFPNLFSHPLLLNTFLKCVINIHSTLIMGIMGRYQDNLMTWVKPSNNKLIDRAARYTQYLLKNKGQEKNYEDIIKIIFKKMNSFDWNQSFVESIVKEFD